jgi:hypothetical protein
MIAVSFPSKVGGGITFQRIFDLREIRGASYQKESGINSITKQLLHLMKPPRSKLRGITRKGIVCETPRFLTLFPLQGNLEASSEESPD